MWLFCQAGEACHHADMAASTTYPELLTSLRDSGAIPELAQAGDDFRRAKAKQLFPLALKALASMWKPAERPPAQGQSEEDGTTQGLKLLPESASVKWWPYSAPH